MNIHTVNFSRKERRLFPACTSTDFHDYIFIVIRVFRQKQNLKFLLQLSLTRFGIIQFLLGKLAHLLIGFLI